MPSSNFMFNNINITNYMYIIELLVTYIVYVLDQNVNEYLIKQMWLITIIN